VHRSGKAESGRSAESHRLGSDIDDKAQAGEAMQRQEWTSKLGLGRHRISSTIYFYIESPAGGAAEYSADTDCLWQPRIWGPLFGNQHWIVDLSRVSNKATG
jgi:hypothetical protein